MSRVAQVSTIGLGKKAVWRPVNWALRPTLSTYTRAIYVGMVWEDGERLRVVTAGNIGNIESYIGEHGFDVVKLDDEPSLLSELEKRPDIDAVVIEADLCKSLESVAKLVPAAIIIVVGDHTPEGALGRIEAGVTGMTMAGLLHALAAGGVAAAAAIPGFVPAEPKPPGPPPGRPHGRMGRVVASSAVGTVLVAAMAAAIIGGGEHRAAAPASSRSATSSPSPIIIKVSPDPSPSSAQEEEREVAERSPKVSEPVSLELLDSSSVAAAPAPSPAPQAPPNNPPSPAPSPSPTTSPEPPGNNTASTQRPKHEDNGKHLGWSQGHRDGSRTDPQGR